MADSIYTFDPVAGNNTSLDTIPYGPNQLYHNQIDNLFRAINAKTAQFVDDLGAVNTVGGTGDAVTVTLASGITAYATGQIFRFVAGAANTGAATMNVNSIGAKAIRKTSGGTDVALSAGDIAAGETYLVRYSATANSAAGAWILVGLSAAVATSTTTQQLTGTSTAVYSTPDSIAALWEKGSDEASAGTVSFGEGGFFHITGTTTITDLDFDTAKDGRTVDVVFDGVLTLTHNGTTLQLPGGANITTAAGDRARFVQDNSDNIICLYYQRAGHSPMGWETIDVQTLSAASSYARTGLSAYRELRLTYSLRTSGDGVTLFLRTSTDNGSSYDSGASDYSYQINYAQGSSAAGLQGSTSGVYMFITNVGNATGEGACGVIDAYDFNQALYGNFTMRIGDTPATGSREAAVVFTQRVQSTARNAIQVVAGSGTISGRIILEGIRG